MMKRYMGRLASLKLPIRITVVTVFIFATVITATLAVTLQYYSTKKLVTENTLSQFNSLTGQSSRYLEWIDRRAGQVAKIIASYPALVQDNWTDPQARDLFAEVMRNNRMLYAIYLGFANGDFYEVINLESSSAVRQQLRAAAGDRWVVIEISGEAGARKRRYFYYDDKFNLRVSREESSQYNASQRPWFRQAVKGEVNKSAPYMFHNLQAPGQTYSMKVGDTGAVIAVDIALSSLSEFFDSDRITSGGQIFLYQSSGDLIVSNVDAYAAESLPVPKPMPLSDEEQALLEQYPVLKVSNEIDWAPIDFAISGEPHGYSIDYLNMLSALTGIRFNYVNGYTWQELTERFKAGDIDLLQPVFKTEATQYLGLFSEPLVSLPYSMVTRPGRKTLKHIDEAAGWTVAIPKGWSIIDVIRTHFPGINIREVSSTLAVLEAVKRGEVDAGLDIGLVLSYTAEQYFFHGLHYHPQIDFSPVDFPHQLHLVLEQDKTGLLALLNKAIANVNAEQKQALKQKWLLRETSPIETATVPYAELVELSRQTEKHGVLQELELDGVPHFVYVVAIGNGRGSENYFAITVPTEEVLAPAMQKVMLTIGASIGFLLLLAPVPWLFASPIVTPIKKLADENEKIKQRQYALVEKPSSHIKEIDDLGQSMLDMSVSIKQHEENQKALMDSFIQLIAGAIDDKSPYTARHCERVPKLAFMLTDKAEQAENGIFKGFRFNSEEEWREFKTAAWLHDCGKITTPDHVVDKGSKLETIYNRIHEIRTRFEVLLRDAELDYWRQRELHPEREAELKAERDRKQMQIRDDFEFVARMNVGGEFLGEDKKARIKQIAEMTWTRNLDNRIGLSPLEETRLTDNAPPLPVQEKLLQDKPEHLIERLHSTDYDPKLGIKMHIPHYLYNQGELYNLLIERGTLTAEDRFKINEHIIATIRMLENLPFPDELKRVPRYASTHHETLIGTGYPRKLKAEDLSVPERIMVLADIYEALTAADRPYKKAKPVSVAVDILYRMVEDEHVDREVFELFLTSGVYLDYARRFLPESQIDEVDINKYLKRA